MKMKTKETLNISVLSFFNFIFCNPSVPFGFQRKKERSLNGGPHKKSLSALWHERVEWFPCLSNNFLKRWMKIRVEINVASFRIKFSPASVLTFESRFVAERHNYPSHVNLWWKKNQFSIYNFTFVSQNVFTQVNIYVDFG